MPNRKLIRFLLLVDPVEKSQIHSSGPLLLPSSLVPSRLPPQALFFINQQKSRVINRLIFFGNSSVICNFAV